MIKKVKCLNPVKRALPEDFKVVAGEMEFYVYGQFFKMKDGRILEVLSTFDSNGVKILRLYEVIFEEGEGSE